MSDYSVMIGGVRDLLGDIAADEWDAGVLDRALRIAIGRYGQVYERIEANVTTLVNGGLYDLELSWAGLTVPKEVAYLHWPASATVAASVGENKLVDWWYWYVPGTTNKPRFGVQVSGTTNPATSDYILYYGVLDHQVDGMTPDEYGAGSAATSTSVPKNHFYALQLGAAAYALRSRESGLSVTASSEPGFIDAYHVGVLAELADKMLRDFEYELAKIEGKRLERPTWGARERKRQKESGR